MVLPRLDRIDGAAQRLRTTGRFEANVERSLVRRESFELFRHRGGIDRLIGTYRPGDLEGLIDHVGGNDLTRARISGRKDQKATNGAAAGHQNPFVSDPARLAHSMKAHREWFRERGLPERDIAGDR